MPEVTSNIETITPDMAAQWLERSQFANRRLRTSHVKSLAQDIRDGRWQLNGETIVFDRHGNLLNGQHRLWAIIEANRAAPSIIVRNVDQSAFATIDSGLKRSGGDVLQASGLKNAVHLAAAVRLIHFVLVGNHDTLNRMANAQTLELVERYDGIEEATSLVINSSPVRRIITASPLVAVLYFALKHNRDRAHEFLRGLATGEGLIKGDPRLTVRAFYLNHNLSRKTKTYIQLALLIKAWNAFAQHKELHSLRLLSNESFPLPLGVVPQRRRAS